jgi:hypothetical protein
VVERRGYGMRWRWSRYFRITELLEKIVHRLALGVDGYGRPVVLERLRRPLLVRGKLDGLSCRGY